MTKKITWRLKTLPTPDEVRELVKDKIITQDEAREILFAQENETERDLKSLEAEIKFLREIVEKLSANRTQVIETIKTIEKPYYQYHWYKPYEVWCGSTTANGINVATAGTMYLSSGGSFSSINTF